MSQFNHVAIDIHVRRPGVPQAFAQDGTYDRVPAGDTLLWGAGTTQAISGTTRNYGQVTQTVLIRRGTREALLGWVSAK